MKPIRFFAFLISIMSICPLLAQEDHISVTSEVLFKGQGVAIGSPVEQFAKITVTKEALEAPLSVYLTGTAAKHFSLSLSTIPAGTGETVIYLKFDPKAPGIHKANINIESDTNYDLNQMLSLQGIAYDPANPPSISISAGGIVPFSAKAGEKQTQTFTITTANLLDWNGTIRIVEQSTPGTFMLSSTSLLKTGTNTYTVTFSPKATGTFTATLEASALLVSPQRFSISGSCTDPSAETEKEGVDFALSAENPLSSYSTSFDGVLRNKPFSMDGWVNSAMKGSRAWWGFDFDGDACAKVTPYDSKASSGTPCQMLLVSPALDARNSASKLVTFRLRGDFLADGQTDLLEVLYIDLADGTPYIQPIEMSIPCTKDESGEWKAYILNFEGQQIADTFFIGFRFTSTRGTDNSATYYVDDFTWGIDDGAGIAGAKMQSQPRDSNIYDLTGRIQKTAQKGIYIRNGKKYLR